MASESESHLLEFQDIPFTHGRQTSPNSSTYVFSSTENDSENSPVEATLRSEVKFSIFSFEFYRKFFDVDTDVVWDRIAENLWFLNKKNAGPAHPDFYGPIWLSATLICVLAVFGGIFEFSASNKNPIDYRLISTFAALIFSYVFLQPSILWIGFRWRRLQNGPGLARMINIFGYSLSIYIPCCVLMVIPINFVQWILISTAFIISSLKLVSSFSSILKQNEYVVKIFVASLILALNLALALSFKVRKFENSNLNHCPAFLEILKKIIGSSAYILLRLL